jgi:hypothetical protein
MHLQVDSTEFAMNTQTDPLLSAEELLPIIFGEKNKPSLRWLRSLTKRRTVPHLKIGHLVRYDPTAVREALKKNCEVKAKGAAA